jgi:hypothetical protein
MKFFSSQGFITLLFATLSLQPAVAQTAAPKPPPTTLRAIITPGAIDYLDGNRLLARTVGDKYSVFLYRQGRLSRISHSDGRSTTYHYRDGQLDHIAFSEGTVQKAIHEGGRLLLIESSSGRKLGLAADAGAVDKMLAPAVGKDGTALPRRSAPVSQQKATPAQRIHAMNQTLIAIEGWEATEWECSLTPEGEQICTGRGGGGQDDGGGYHPGHPGDWGPGDSPGEADPGGGGNGGSGGGGADPIRPDLPTRASCYQAAYNTWVIMRDQFCPMVLNQQVCLQNNYQLFLDLRTECEATYP